MSEPDFPRPIRQDVEKAIKAFDDYDGIGEWLLGELFKRYPRNTEESVVRQKVEILNRLYSTRLYDVEAMTARILGVQSFDALLYAGSTEAAESIISCEANGKTRSTFSFASKYCSWHKQNAYPLYDRFVDECLWYYQSRDDFSRYKRSSYPAPSYAYFVEIVKAFRSRYELEFSFKDLDKFLTIRGQEIVEARTKAGKPLASDNP